MIHEHHHHHEHGDECHCGHHHHEDEALTSKYEQALALYDCNLDDEQVQKEVDTLLANHLQENNTVEVKKFLLNSVELTTLKTTDSEDSVLKFVEKVNEFDDRYPELGHVATVCVYPNFAKICHDTLENEDVEIACVSACFPSSQSFLEIKVAETALALKDGATEIDIVMPVGKFLVGDYEGVAAVIDKDRASAKLALDLKADMLVILTAVEKVAINFNKPDQKNLDQMTVAEARQYITEGHFAPGSMLPKVESCISFVENTEGGRALITSLEKAREALQGKTGTMLVKA